MTDQSNIKWPEVRLGDCARVKARLGWKGLKADEYVLDGPIFLAAPNLKGGRIDFDNVDHLPQWRYEESPEIQLAVGDVLLVKDGSTLGMSSIVRTLPAPTTVNGSIAVIRPGGPLASGFLFYSINGQGFQRLIWLRRSGLGVPHLFQADLREFRIPLPSLAEQNKIDDILSTLDKTIAQTEALIAKYQQIKVGMVQDLFTRGVATDGRLRPVRSEASHLYKQSPLGWIPHDWQIATAKQVFETITKGATPIQVSSRHSPTKIPFIRVQNLTFDGLLDFSVDAAFVSESCHLGELARSIVVPADILMNIVGPPLGKVSLVPNDYPEWNINQAIARFRPRNCRDRQYLLIYLLSEVAQSWFRARSKRTSGQVNLTLEMCRDLPVPLPLRFEEQAAIVEAVRCGSETIVAERLWLQTLRQLKLGLSHDLITGRVRVGTPKSEEAIE